MTAVQGFLKKIGPVGCTIFLLIFVLFLVVCFTQGRDLLKGYEPPREAVYYRSNPRALQEDLERTVMPLLPGIVRVDWHEGDTAVTVTVAEDDYFPVRRSLLRHFPQELLVIQKEAGE